MNTTAPDHPGTKAAGIIARYGNYLPIGPNMPAITLGEGATPLLFAAKLSRLVGGGCEVFIKCEGQNPTGSFKDRGMTVAVSKAKESGGKVLLCASTGNTSASAAAYAVRARLQCAVILPAGKIAKGKMAQAFAHGATVVAIDGNFDQALEIVRSLGERPEFVIVNSINPDRIAGQKTAAFEIVDELGDAPDIHLLPVGNAGNITAYWAGYRQFHSLGRSHRLPRMIGFQAAGAAPIVSGKAVPEPETVATAIRIGNPASWQQANVAVEESLGGIEAVPDAEILAAQRWLASEEGIFVEPASAAPIAGLMRAARNSPSRRFVASELPEGARVVCTVTGHGLKDPEAIAQRVVAPVAVAPNEDAVLRALATQS